MGAVESHTKPRMLQQDRPSNAAYGGMSSSLRLLSNGPQQFNRKCEKDSNFNFLGEDTNDTLGGDENRNQVRPRSLGPMGRELPSPMHHVGAPLGPLSPLSRLPCWSPLEPLPEVESGDDGGGRVPPEGAEEGRIDEEMRRPSDLEKEKERELEESQEYSGKEVEEEEEDGFEWGDSDEEFAFSSHSSSVSSLVDGVGGGEAGLGNLPSVWDRLCIGGPPSAEQDHTFPGPRGGESFRGILEGMEPGDEDGSSDSDWDGGGGGGGGGGCGVTGDEALEALWSAQDRQRFKEQEMQKHQLQLTMYRRLALIRWVRTLQGRVQDQQNRLQDSFDVILTHRKELLRMGAAASH
ncbi:UPF0500 protein C1orf216 homolog isoform X2 [Sardina pilchardus]|uniref:UPF0500 protein C1orf216 homolog isoform X2 n=1 Tax=Sardina pilchardus TaxID=27697 RepID=UPI002E13953E